MCHVCISEPGSGPFYMDHPPAVYTVCGSDLGTDRCEQLMCAGSPHFAGYHTSLAITEDGASPVRMPTHINVKLTYT